MEGHDNPIESVSFSPDGKTVVTGSWDRTATLWDLQGNELQTLEGHTGWVRDVAFSPDGSHIATASSDQTVRLWEQGEEGFELRRTLWAHNGPVNSVSFSQNGKYVLSSDGSGRFILGPVDLNMDIDMLLQKACDWASDYLQHGFDAAENRQLCDGV
ncbi:MAG: hypothetical protein AAF289_01395 [Cyanobacteria bacterium P01_A01_bin.135]